ncbi:uncharacterized protein SPPG_09004 [Spizellomyces punctatus DAOM BR117]|uniref:G-protein coupled receptors family 3 profile domain-containing protein n=1 Tax=Spizellomyces punctatus (strain DAOM BR117) TaxID=645134 RepID=A0A0L0HP40_SPIPD|nr:uncharacterized protein SPPG_09004 [Spizellomyces punctatus DAOM BR117]KND03171.1 hypothetical protein SPPG_09004 [Spizellomyces punctatus DAOM BR117]|eukprot:XP_016611210.1 hypothetical protein SPPG_09004 [Spizellomyces punctatus DAOM BR117]
MIYNLDDFGTPAAESVRRRFSSHTDITLLGLIGAFHDGTEEDVDGALDQLLALHAKVIVTVVYSECLGPLMLHARQKGMTGPEYVWINVNLYTGLDGADTSVSVLRSAFDDRLVDYDIRGTIVLAARTDVMAGYAPNDAFMTKWMALNPNVYPGVVPGQPPISGIVKAYTSAYVLLLGIHQATFGPNATTTIGDVVNRTAGDALMPSTFADTGFISPVGAFKLDANGDGITRQRISIYIADADTADLGYIENGNFHPTLADIPWKVPYGADWSTTKMEPPVGFIYNEQYVKWDGAAITILVLFSAGILVNCVIGAYLVRHVHSAPVKAASPVFLSLMWLGYSLGYISPFFRIGKPTFASCRASYWIEVIPFGLVMAPLAVKTFRIWRIFGNRKAKTLRLSDSLLLQLVGAIMSLNVLLLIVHTAFGNVGPTVTPDDSQATMAYACGSTNGRESVISGIGAALVAYNGIVVLCCTYFAFKTRGVVARFSESAYIGISVYTTLLCSVFILVIDNIPGTTVMIHFLIREILILIMLLTSMSALLGKVVVMNLSGGTTKDGTVAYAGGNQIKRTGDASGTGSINKTGSLHRQNGSTSGQGNNLMAVSQDFSVINLSKWVNKWEPATIILHTDGVFPYILLKIGKDMIAMELKDTFCDDFEGDRECFKLHDNHGHSFRVQTRSSTERQNWVKQIKMQIRTTTGESTSGLVMPSSTSLKPTQHLATTLQSSFTERDLRRQGRMSDKALNKKLKDISARIDSIRLDWDALRKELRTNLLTDPETAHISRDWAQFVFKKQFGQNVAGSAVTTEAEAESPTGSDKMRDSVAKLRIRLGAKIRSSVSREGTQQGEATASGGKKKPPTCAEEIAQIVETWIAAKQDPADISSQFRPLDPGKNLSALLAANATHSNRTVAALCSLPRSLVKEKTNNYKLPKEAVMHLHWFETPVDTGLTPSVPVPSKLDLDISSLNESIEKHGQSHKTSLEKDLADAWDPVRQVLRGLLQVECEQKRILTVELAKRVNEYSRKYAIALRNFDEFWNSKTEKWKKKGGKKNGAANGVDEGALAEEADALFEQYIEQIKIVADAYAEEVLQPILSELRRAVETYESLLSDLLKSSDLDPNECERARQAISGLGRRTEEHIDEFLRNESKSRASLTCALSDMKDSYLEGSMKTLWGRLEKCSNRDFRKRIANMEADQQKERDMLSTVLVSDVAPFSSVAVVCLVVLECLLVKGERCEEEALLKHKTSLQSDVKLQELAITRKTLEGYYETGVFSGQIELGRKIGRVLWSVVKQSMEAAMESQVVAYISKSGGGKSAGSAASAESGANAVDEDTKKKKKKKKKAKTGTGEAGAANVDSVTPPIEEPSGSPASTVPDTPKEDESDSLEQVASPINGKATKEEEALRPEKDVPPVKANSVEHVSPSPKETMSVQENEEVDLDLSQIESAIGDVIVPVGGLTGARPSGPPGFTGTGMWGGNNVFPFSVPAFPMNHPLNGMSSPTSQELVSLRDENTSLRNENTQLRRERAALEEQLRAAQHTISHFMQRMRGLESQESVKRPGYNNWNRRTAVSCGNCGERGHESTACDAGCRYCSSREHLSDVCPLLVV